MGLDSRAAHHSAYGWAMPEWHARATAIVVGQFLRALIPRALTSRHWTGFRRFPHIRGVLKSRQLAGDVGQSTERAQKPPKNNAQGDQIFILNDANGDGHAGSCNMSDHRDDMLTALSIALLGNKVIVS